MSFEKERESRNDLKAYCHKHIHVRERRHWRGWRVNGWEIYRLLFWSSELRMESVGCSVRREDIVRSIIIAVGGIDVHTFVNQARELRCSLPFLPHLTHHFSNVCIWQKAFWRHVNCVGGILEYKEEFVPSDQETRKCLENSNMRNPGKQMISSSNQPRVAVSCLFGDFRVLYSD